MTIYLITNKINGKRYVGRTKNPKQRWKGHQRIDSCCTLLRNAIQHYGAVNFIFEEIFYVLDRETVDYYENFFIDYYNTFYPNGYNLLKGVKMREISDFTREKVSQNSIRMWKNPEYIKKISKIRKETWTYEKKEEQSRKQKIVWQNEEIAEKRLSGIKTYIENKKVPVAGVCRFNGDILKFESSSSASEAGFHVEGCLYGKDLYSNNYVWFVDNEESDEELRNKALEKLGSFDSTDISQISCVDKKTKEERIYKDVSEIKEEGIHDVSAIKAVFKGKRKTYHGKFWKVLSSSQ